MGSEDHRQIVKGKRTKRQRSSSPFGFAVTDSSSSGSGDVDDYNYHYNNNSISFSTTSGEIHESTEEEEDMANCLIMLAQGDRPRQNIDNKFTATVTYECKTCNRTFASFQALGGHRASHKKPKATLEADKKSSSMASADAAVVPIKDDFDSGSPFVHHHNKGNKIHECSICGSEFTSGQALGGHMRRHRTATNQVTNESNINGDIKPAASVDVAAATRRFLPLDLNLPAPEDDHYVGFGTTQQSLVFSAPALVDCHY